MKLRKWKCYSCCCSGNRHYNVTHIKQWVVPISLTWNLRCIDGTRRDCKNTPYLCTWRKNCKPEFVPCDSEQLSCFDSVGRSQRHSKYFRNNCCSHGMTLRCRFRLASAITQHMWSVIINTSPHSLYNSRPIHSNWITSNFDQYLKVKQIENFLKIQLIVKHTKTTFFTFFNEYISERWERLCTRVYFFWLWPRQVIIF